MASYKSMRDFYIPPLLKKNRVITIDLLGRGRNRMHGIYCKRWRITDAVHAVLSNYEYAKLFCGHSMGGYVALAYT
jgi:pimeloyl-ACP methyl ester carboxylesterase